MEAIWQPLSKRDQGLPPAALREEVPFNLAMAMGHWLQSFARIQGTDPIPWHRIALRLDAELPTADGHWVNRPWQAAVLNHMAVAPLDVIDAALYLCPEARRQWEQLQQMFEDAGSAWHVNERCTGLERRVDPTVVAAYTAATTSAHRAGKDAATERLKKAWESAYGLTPDPGAAYRHAVAAVEDIAGPLFLPNSPLPTLGTVLSTLSQGRAKYQFVIVDQLGSPASIDVVVEMISTLWHGQRDRHEGGPTSFPIKQESAEAAVHLAAVLVQWFANGAVAKKR